MGTARNMTSFIRFRDFKVWALLGMKGTPAFLCVGIGAGVPTHSPQSTYGQVVCTGNLTGQHSATGCR